MSELLRCRECTTDFADSGMVQCPYCGGVLEPIPDEPLTVDPGKYRMIRVEGKLLIRFREIYM